MIWIVVLFAAYFLWKAPTVAADAVTGAANAVGSFFDSITIFLRRVIT